MSRPTSIVIDLQALNHNLIQVKRYAPKSSIIAMVKSDAYGHGIQPIGLALAPYVEALGVACMEEGLVLREAGIKTPIVLMEGLFKPAELEQAAKFQFSLIIHHAAQIEMLEKHSKILPLTVWLKIDTGMHRLGINPSDTKMFYQRLSNCPNVKKPIGLMTHFAESESFDRHFTLEQIKIFNETTKGLTGPRSFANSAGIIAWPETHVEWIRPGLMLYGVSPFLNKTGKDHQLKPVMSLYSELIAIHDISPGDRVGYGGTWIAKSAARVGIIPIGYGDGYPWHAKNGTPVLVNQKMASLAGRVSMDMIGVDLSHHPEAKVGDSVTLWGEGLPVEKIAQSSDTIGYELLTRINAKRIRVSVKK